MRECTVFVGNGVTGDFIKNIFAGKVSNPVAMSLVPDMDASGDPELAILGDDSFGVKNVQIHLRMTHHLEEHFNETT